MTMTTREVLETAAAYIKEAIDQLPADPPEVPERVEEWPDDDTHLRGDFWKDKQGYVWGHGNGTWSAWLPHYRRWSEVSLIRPIRPPFTRTTDPSVPRTWDTLDDVPEDVERVTGYYLRASRELARSPLSESGWFERPKDDPFRWWMELPATETRIVTNIKEGQS